MDNLLAPSTDAALNPIAEGRSGVQAEHDRAGRGTMAPLWLNPFS